MTENAIKIDSDERRFDGNIEERVLQGKGEKDEEDKEHLQKRNSKREKERREDTTNETSSSCEENISGCARK